MGAIFNDGTLNLQYIDPDSGEINPIFTHKEENNRISIRCEICGLTVVGKVSLDTHRTGKKHKANLEKYEMSGADVPPPGEDALLPHQPIIFKIFDKFDDAPLLGLEYLVEIIHGPNVDPSYECLLCRTKLAANDVISCVISAKHRLKYLEKFYPIAFGKFNQVPNMDVWKKPTFDFLEGVAMRIEQKHGRLSVTNATKIDFDQRKKEFIHNIEAGPHFKQAPDQDFSNLPDPFGSYRSELGYKDFGLGQRDDQGLDYIEDPDHLSLMQREISR